MPRGESPPRDSDLCCGRSSDERLLPDQHPSPRRVSDAASNAIFGEPREPTEPPNLRVFSHDEIDSFPKSLGVADDLRIEQRVVRSSRVFQEARGKREGRLLVRPLEDAERVFENLATARIELTTNDVELERGEPAGRVLAVFARGEERYHRVVERVVVVEEIGRQLA